MLQTLTRARDAAGPRPGSRECLDGRVLTAAGYADAVRWRDGDRLEHVFEARCDRLREQGQADRLAVDAGDVTLTYAELDARANRLARFLVRRGVRPGDRIGLLFDEAIDSYTGMLAVLKAHAAYVPLDAAFPARPAGVHRRRRRPAAGADPFPAGSSGRIAGCRDRGAAGGPGTGRGSGRDPRTGWGRARSRPRRMTCATSSTPRARPAARRAWRSPTRASATSCGWRPRSTA